MTKAAATSAMRLTSTFTPERMGNVTAGDVIATGCTPSDSFAFVVDTVSGSWLDNCMTSTTTKTINHMTWISNVRGTVGAKLPHDAPRSTVLARAAALAAEHGCVMRICWGDRSATQWVEVNIHTCGD